MALFHVRGQLLHAAAIVAELGDGAVQPGLPVGDQTLVIGAHLGRFDAAVAGGESVDGHDRGAHAHPQGAGGGQGRGRGLLAGAQNDGAKLSAGADIEVPFRKDVLEKRVKPGQALKPHKPPPPLAKRFGAI